jgi:hypothetical protein
MSFGLPFFPWGLAMSKIIKPATTLNIINFAFVAVLTVFGLAACLDSGSSTNTGEIVSVDPDAPESIIPIVAPSYPTPTPIPAAPYPAAIAAVPGVPGSIRITTDTTGMQVGDSVEILQTGTHGAYLTPYDGGVTLGAYEGIFTVSAMSPTPGGPGGTFDVAITFTTPTGASTQIIAGGTPPACATEEIVVGDGAAFPTLSISASRYTGVAPLAVFFDSSGTTSTATSRPFHELDYQWDFDDSGIPGHPAPAGSPLDPAIGTWGTTVDGTGSSGSGANTSRKTDSGPVAAHVYERPGTYRVRMTVRDVNGKSVTNNCIQIAVQDPEQIFAGKTACFSNTADFTGCPASVPLAARFTTSNFVTAMANDSTFKRLLFHRGHTFDAAARVRMQAAGPGLVGAFGAGAAPKVRLTYNGDLFQPGGPVFADWRITDLELDLNTAGNLARGLKAAGNMTDVLLQRLWVHNGGNGYTFSDPSPDSPWDKMFLVDTTFQNLAQDATHGQACFMSGHRVAYMGNRVNSTNSHNSRFPFLDRAVISHNYHNSPGVGTSNLKIHATDFPTYPNSFTEKVVISSNRFVSGSADWMIELQPQSRHNDERLRNIVVERNKFEAAAGFSPYAMSISGADITLRNNIVDGSASPTGLGFTVGQFGDCAVKCEPLPSSIDLFHNTIYTSQGPTGSTLKLIELRSAISTAFPAKVKNNLGYAPNQPGGGQAPQLISDLATGTIKSGNSANSDLLSTNPGFAGDFSVTGAYPVAGDATVPVMTDFFGAVRAKPGAGTVGADQFP